MNNEQLKGKWEQLKGAVKEQWGKLTDDDIKVIGGEKDQLVGKLKERYGIAKERAEQEVARFFKSDKCGCSDSSSKKPDDSQRSGSWL